MITEKNVKLNSKRKIESKKRFVIISDTHISRSGGAFNLHTYNLGIEQINKIQDVDLFLHLGDITQNGTLLEYEYASEQLEKIQPISKCPLIYLIGNHDAMNVGDLLFEEMIAERHVEYEDDDIFIIGIDSTKPDLPGGIIRHNIIELVRKELMKRERENKFKVVCFHHQLIPIPYTGKERSAIDDSGDMLQMLLEAKADLVLNGHRHTSNLYTLSSSEKDLYIYNAGTFSCNKTRYRDSFTYAIIDIEGCKLTFRVIPVLDSSSLQEIHREVNYYLPLEIKGNKKPLCRFIQLSNSLINEGMENKITNLDRAIEKINTIQDIDLVMHTGNVTQNSYKEEFRIAKNKINKITYPCLVVPGYTDSKPPYWEYWRRYFGEFDPFFENEEFYIQGFNSATKDSTEGSIGRNRMDKFIGKVLKLNHRKILGVCCFHSLIPTPLSIWRTELMDSGDVLSRLTRARIDLCLNSSPSIAFNVKIDNTVFTNGGNLNTERFEDAFIEIEIYEKGSVILKEHNLKTGQTNIVGTYTITIFI
ncbi:MAG: metallophosphoesterase family protein [Promethearchaeota archaeon]|jgi:3',5'-cyclic AMP phosphodiesterase CpdA